MSEVFFFTQMLFRVCVNETEGNSRRGPCPNKKKYRDKRGLVPDKGFSIASVGVLRYCFLANHSRFMEL